MNILRGEDKQEFMNLSIQNLLVDILKRRPSSISTRSLDYEVVGGLLTALSEALVLADYDGARIRLSYLPEDE